MSVLTQLAQATQYYYYESSNTLTPDETAAATAAIVGLMIFMLIFVIVAYVVSAFLLSRIFQKAGVEGWKAWVPVYSTWTMLELGGQQGFWAILLFVPVVNIAGYVFVIIAMYNIGLKFGKDAVFFLLAIFLPIVWYAILAFDKSTWQGTAPVAYAAPGAPIPTVAPQNIPPAAPAYQPPVQPQAPVTPTEDSTTPPPAQNQ